MGEIQGKGLEMRKMREGNGKQSFGKDCCEDGGQSEAPKGKPPSPLGHRTHSGSRRLAAVAHLFTHARMRGAHSQACVGQSARLEGAT